MSTVGAKTKNMDATKCSCGLKNMEAWAKASCGGAFDSTEPKTICGKTLAHSSDVVHTVDKVIGHTKSNCPVVLLVDEPWEVSEKSKK